ncbi:DUF6089 family protein [Bernardetia sp.]|uniref:type IX secretion system protein PorG n=1 Tax=Bernardetia sp. TaxID=1937974 RepID=UPI0025BD48DE|nr:DUF6089 family protein [Bernardetia sp.]
MIFTVYKKAVLSVLCVLFSFTLCNAQDLEFGFGAGVMNYTGDISPSYKVKNLRPAGEFFVRLNPNPIFSFRFGAAIGAIGADETDSEEPFFQQRAAKFAGTVYEVSGRAEYNFRDYRAMSELNRLSPYIFLGGSVAHISVNSNYFDSQPNALEIAIPVGVGLKYMLGQNYNLGFEFGARPTFTDAIDGMLQDSNADEVSSVGKFQMTNLFTKDMYYYTGISLSFTISRVVCPAEFR